MKYYVLGFPELTIQTKEAECSECGKRVEFFNFPGEPLCQECRGEDDEDLELEDEDYYYGIT